jgi:hypothetical protein
MRVVFFNHRWDGINESYAVRKLVEASANTGIAIAEVEMEHRWHQCFIYVDMAMIGSTAMVPPNKQHIGTTRQMTMSANNLYQTFQNFWPYKISKSANCLERPRQETDALS